MVHIQLEDGVAGVIKLIFHSDPQSRRTVLFHSGFHIKPLSAYNNSRKSRLEDIPRRILVLGDEYELASCTLYQQQRHHFVAVIWYQNRWIRYDGLDTTIKYPDGLFQAYSGVSTEWKKLDVVHVRTLNWWASNAPPYVDPRAGRAHRRFKQEPEEAPNPGIHLAVNNSTDPQDECDDQEEASHQVPEAPEDV
ncbi:unnamed protein product [Allacma fusca]|uniref:Uncharacterized protein n=1 Tax=Allacma fusca TaxID=39272 RepID=A0A8J2K450_9HEXA|nr:unnamed protein product [Allacma fusca]